jgi:hypothetical protein
VKDFLSSQKFKKVLWIIGGIAAVFLIFGCGIAVGYHKALFSSSWGQNYYQNFYGDDHAGPMGPLMDHAPWNAHGVVGSVIGISSSTISLRDDDNDERSVEISSNTIIRKMNATISVNMINDGDNVTVIGEPNENGQVYARFVRVFGVSSSMPLPPLPPPPMP